MARTAISIDDNNTQDNVHGETTTLWQGSRSAGGGNVAKSALHEACSHKGSDIIEICDGSWWGRIQYSGQYSQWSNLWCAVTLKHFATTCKTSSIKTQTAVKHGITGPCARPPGARYLNIFESKVGSGWDIMAGSPRGSAFKLSQPVIFMARPRHVVKQETSDVGKAHREFSTCLSDILAVSAYLAAEDARMPQVPCCGDECLCSC